MKEAKITEDVRYLLEEYQSKNLLKYYKASDRFTSGLADFIGCFIGGRMFHIELKAPKEKLRKLQAYTLWDFNKCHAAVIGSDDFEAVREFIEEGIRNGRRSRNKPPIRPISDFLEV